MSSKIVWRGGSVFTKAPIRAILQDRPAAAYRAAGCTDVVIVAEGLEEQ